MDRVSIPVSERLHKVLANHGLGSRREIEEWMRSGRVLVNGQPAQPGTRFESGDRITLDGRDVTRRLQTATASRVVVYNKAPGESLEGTQDALKLRLPAVRGSRWIAINRMPPGDSGLVIFTTDGQLANALMRQAPTRSSVYSVRVLLPAPDFETAHLATGVEYDDERVEFTSVESAGGEGANRWFQVVAPHADRRAAVRALFESQGLKVSRLIQIRYGGIDLPRDLPRGRHRALSAPVVAALREQAGLEPEPPKAAPDRPRARSPRKRHGSPPRRNALRKVKRTHK